MTTKPICKIAQETGTVPLACLFGCSHNCKETHEQERMDQSLGFDDQTEFRVWPDGTVQAVEDGAPYSHKSDDFVLIWAADEEEALFLAGI